MVRVGPILLLLSACSADGDPAPSEVGPPETPEPRDLRVERVASGAPGEGTYVVAYGGQRPTGGYYVEVAGARVKEDRVTVRVSLEDPRQTPSLRSP